MKFFGTILVIFFLNSCAAQVNNNKSNMETFNISEFESHKIGGEYLQVLDDGTIITQFGNTSGYYEKVVPPGGLFYTYKEFYGNGCLKLSGLAFKHGDYQEGTWIKYDQAGNKTNETNYNNNYRLTYEDIFKILDDRRISYSLKDKYFSITRGIVNSKGIWIVEWKVMETRIERLTIDDSTKAVTQDYSLFKGDN